jgi:hypothetical protein
MLRPLSARATELSLRPPAHGRAQSARRRVEFASGPIVGFLRSPFPFSPNPAMENAVPAWMSPSIGGPRTGREPTVAELEHQSISLELMQVCEGC